MSEQDMSYWYLATPYSKYPKGLDEAWREACRQAAFLLRNGVYVYCPIAHTHPVADVGLLDKKSHDFWLPVDEIMMQASAGMIQCRMPGWEESYGMQWERGWFESREKPVVPMEPYTIPGHFVEAV